MSSPLVERLVKKIERDCNISCDPESFERTYAGVWQKRSGAYVWTMRLKGSNPTLIGSGMPASELVKKKYYLEMDNNGEIFGEEYPGKEKKP